MCQSVCLQGKRSNKNGNFIRLEFGSGFVIKLFFDAHYIYIRQKSILLTYSTK